MLYLSPLLKERYPNIFQEIKEHVPISELPLTNDIWVRDFMPIKNANGHWVLFRYFPKYLQAPQHHPYISDNKKICDAIGLAYTYSDIILDGGSIVYHGDMYCISERVYQDNVHIPKADLYQQLQTLLQTDNVHILPCDPDDFTGHLDGIITFIDDHTILLNDGKEAYLVELRNYFSRLGKKIISVPFNPYTNRTLQSAKGIYINFVISESVLLLPVFNLPEDEKAITLLTSVYPNYTIVPILCNKLATQGGLLHCVSWEQD